MAKYNFENGVLDMKSYDSIKKEIKNKLEEVVNDIFLKYQTDLDIDNGDIGIDYEIELECSYEELSTTITDALNYQLAWMNYTED